MHKFYLFNTPFYLFYYVLNIMWYLWYFCKVFDEELYSLGNNHKISERISILYKINIIFAFTM